MGSSAKYLPNCLICFINNYIVAYSAMMQQIVSYDDAAVLRKIIPMIPTEKTLAFLHSPTNLSTFTNKNCSSVSISSMLQSLHFLGQNI